MERRTFIGIIEAGEPLIHQAIDAMRALRAAEAVGAPSEEINRLRVLADSLYYAVIDFQLIKSGQAPEIIQ